MLNWYVLAKRQAKTNPELDELLVKYEQLPKGKDRKELAEYIQSNYIFNKEETAIVEPKEEDIKEDIAKEETPIVVEEKKEFPKPKNMEDESIYAELSMTGEWDINSYKTKEEFSALIGKCQKKIEEMELKRKKYEDSKQTEAFMQNSWKLSKLRFAAQQKIMDINKDEKRKTLLSNKEIPMIARKRTAFINLIKEGYSITNAIQHPNMGNIKPKDILEIVDSNTKNTLNQVKKGWVEMFDRWCEKFLK